jgi:choline dehydrogenase-like flavoprotein
MPAIIRSAHPYDVLIVGSGIMGAAVAAEIRRQRPSARIGMIEAGPIMGTVPAQHLHDVAEPEQRAAYNAHTAAGVQSMYVGAATAGDFVDASATPGLYAFGALGNDADAMPAAATAWNVGGMGAHWTAACPTPWGDEIPTMIDSAEWDADFDRARDILRIGDALFGPTPAGQAVIDALTSEFGADSAGGRGPQVMPMAVSGTSDGGRRRTGPGVIFPELVDRSPLFDLIAPALAVRVALDGRRATGVVVRDLTDDSEHTIDAATVVLCADALRTPQLLFASGIRPDALGRGLNEHAFVTGRVFATPEDLGGVPVPLPDPGEWMSDSLWIPHSGPSQPFHWQVSVSPMYSDDLSTAVAMSVGVSVYVPTEIRDECRIEFSDESTDALGMPRATIHYGYSAADLTLIERAQADQSRAFAAIAGPGAQSNSLLLPPGSSLHYSGTVRMGAHADGTSVVGPDCAVWGVDGLFAAGNGVLPTAVVGNVTSAGVVTAVRAARGAAARIG